MRVYYIGNKYDGCYYVRCLLPLYHNGWDGERVTLEGYRASNQEMFQGAMSSQVIVFQRPDDPKKLEAVPLLQQAGKKVVFDNDDTYQPNSGTPTSMYSLYGKQALERMNSTLIEFVKRADLVTTTTEFLANEYRQHNENVVILPNMIDPDDWGEPIKNETDKVRIGIVGSVASNQDYAPLIPALKALKGDRRIQLVVFAHPPKLDRFKTIRSVYGKDIAFWEQFDIEWQPFVNMSQYHETLKNLKLDMMLIPREESYFNKCKSNIKFLEAAMLEVPVIASSFSDGNSPYDKDIDGTNGLLVKPGESWLEKINLLVEDKRLRQKLGKNARKYALKHYNIHDTYYLWAEAYSKLLND